VSIHPVRFTKEQVEFIRHFCGELGHYFEEETADLENAITYAENKKARGDLGKDYLKFSESHPDATFDDFLDYVQVEDQYRTDFAIAAILKSAQAIVAREKVGISIGGDLSGNTIVTGSNNVVVNE
jgi:hypothetical protein